VANYNVDIGVSVRAQSLNTFNEKLKVTEKSIDRLQNLLKKFKATASFSELSGALKTANNNVDNAIRGTKTYEKALLEAAKAGRLLNKELSERARIQARLTNSESGFGAFSRQAAGLSGRQPRTQPLRVTRQRRRGLNQFSSPIGPSQAPMAGPQLPPNFNAQIRAAVTASRQVEAQVERNAQASIEAAKKVSQIELALDRKLEMAGLKREMNIFKNKEKLAVQSFQNEKRRNKEQVADFDKRLRQATTARSAAGKQKSKSRSDLALGIGFPLLFGGGAGSIAGGALGALGGGGMGGQVLGSAIGGQLDQFAQRTTSFAQALRGAGDVTQELEGFIGVLNSETSRRIKILQESGQTAKAANAAFKELSKTIGVDNAKALVQAGKDFETLGNKTTQFFTILGASIASLFQEAFYLNLRDPLSGVPAASPELLDRRRQAGESLGISRLETAAVRAGGTGNLEKEAEADKAIIRQKKLNDLSKFGRDVEEGKLDIVEDHNVKLKILEDAKRSILQIDLALLDATRQAEKEAERLAEQKKRKQEAKRKQEMREMRQLQEGIFKEDLKQLQIQSKINQLNQSDLEAIETQKQELELVLNARIDQVKLSGEDLSLQKEKIDTLMLEASLRLEGLDQLEEQIKLTEQLNNLSAAAGFDVAGVANNIAPFQRGMGTEGSPVSFEKGAELAPLIEQELQLDKILEKYPMIGEAAQAAAGMVTLGVNEMINGTKSAEEVFSEFLKSVGDMLIKTAQQMIAQYIAIGIAKAFAGLLGGSSSPGISEFGGSFGAFSPGASFNVPALPFAEGGYVTGPTNAVIGEGGEPEYVIPESKMRESMGRYSRGSRGDSVIPASGGGGDASGGGTATLAPIDVRYSVERINSVDYVTADQFQAGMREAASSGAKQGEQRALSTLRQNTTQRRRIGI